MRVKLHIRMRDIYSRVTKSGKSITHGVMSKSWELRQTEAMTWTASLWGRGGFESYAPPRSCHVNSYIAITKINEVLYITDREIKLLWLNRNKQNFMYCHGWFSGPRKVRLSLVQFCRFFQWEFFQITGSLKCFLLPSSFKFVKQFSCVF